MERDDFLKLIATGATTMVIGTSACGSSDEKEKSSNSKSVQATSNNKRLEKNKVNPQITFNSIADLRRTEPDSSEIDKNSRIELLGYHEPEDGGGGIFYWDADATEDDNRGTVIRPHNNKFKGAGRWKRLVNEDQINVKSFGAKGDGSGVDDQPAIQNAIDYAKESNIGEVVIPKGDYTVNIVENSNGRDSSIILKDGIHLKMDDNAILRLPQSENRTSYNIMEIRRADNVTIEGGTIIGNKLTSTATTGQAGLGIGIYNSANSFITGVTIQECWADGIYLSNGRQIELRDVICDNNRRQGMSVINVDGLTITNCEFNNTEGIAPESGIDFEPNRTIEELKKIKIENVKCIGNAGKGILFYLKEMVSTEYKKEVSIELNNIYVENSGQAGISISSFNKPGTGFIKVTDFTVKNNQAGPAYKVKNWHKEAPAIRFKNIIAINPNLSGAGGAQGGSTLTFIPSKRYENGNLHVDGFEVKSDNSAVGKAPKDMFVPPNLWNCSFRNIYTSVNNLQNLLRLDSKRNNILGSGLSKKLKQ